MQAPIKAIVAPIRSYLSGLNPSSQTLLEIKIHKDAKVLALAENARFPSLVTVSYKLEKDVEEELR